MGLTSYAELAVRLVNSASSNGGHQDQLSDPEAFRALLADRSDLRGPVTRVDLEALRHLRDELTAVFSACTQGDPAVAVDRLNALLISHPVHPVIVPAEVQARRERRPYQLSLSRQRLGLRPVRHRRGDGAGHRAGPVRPRPARPLRAGLLHRRFRGRQPQWVPPLLLRAMREPRQCHRIPVPPADRRRRFRGHRSRLVSRAAGVRPSTGGKACPNAPGKPPWAVSAKFLRGPRDNNGLITGPGSGRFVMTPARTVPVLPK